MRSYLGFMRQRTNYYTTLKQDVITSKNYGEFLKKRNETEYWKWHSNNLQKELSEQKTKNTTKAIQPTTGSAYNEEQEIKNASSFLIYQILFQSKKQFDTLCTIYLEHLQDKEKKLFSIEHLIAANLTLALFVIKNTGVSYESNNDNNTCNVINKFYLLKDEFDRQIRNSIKQHNYDVGFIYRTARRETESTTVFLSETEINEGTFPD